MLKSIRRRKAFIQVGLPKMRLCLNFMYFHSFACIQGLEGVKYIG